MKTNVLLGASLLSLEFAHDGSRVFSPNGLVMHHKNNQRYLFLAACTVDLDSY